VAVLEPHATIISVTQRSWPNERTNVARYWPHNSSDNRSILALGGRGVRSLPLNGRSNQVIVLPQELPATIAVLDGSFLSRLT
jgi:hypothetical protein